MGPSGPRAAAAVSSVGTRPAQTSAPAARASAPVVPPPWSVGAWGAPDRVTADHGRLTGRIGAVSIDHGTNGHGRNGHARRRAADPEAEQRMPPVEAPAPRRTLSLSMEPSLMADFLDRQRRAQAAVAPHAEHLAAERRLRAAATAEPDPARRRELLQQADDHAAKAAELVDLVERLANP